ncbi:MAG: gamma-glutamylcyclotransferase [Cyclobacteriaceae bacterium]
MINLFVYGTLRKGGSNHYYMAESRLLRQAYCLRGYVLLNYHDMYPFMIKASAKEEVTGDVYQVDEATLAELNLLEDVENKLYKLAWLPDEGFYTYLKYEQDPEGMPRVAGGDWLAYLENLTS